MRLNIIASPIVASLLMAACVNSEKEEENAVVVNVEKNVTTPIWIPDTETRAMTNGIPVIEEVDTIGESAPEILEEE